MRRMRALFVVLALVMSVSVLAAAKTTVHVVSWYPTTPGGLLDELKRAFEAAYPDYEIEYTSYPSSGYYDRLMTMALADTASDVAMLGFDWIAAMAELGVAMNIDQLVRENFPVDDMFPSIQRALQWQGQYYALSRDITAKVFYYNGDMFAEAGLSHPSDDWTWDEFLAAAKRVHREFDGEVQVWGFVMDFVLDGHYHWFPTNSADWFNFDRTMVTMTDERTVETLQFLHDLIYVHGVAPTPEQRSPLGSAFLNQRAAMHVGGSGTPDPNVYPDLNWKLAMLPQKTQAGSRVWSNLWIIPAGTKNPEAAWKVLSFFAGPEGQRIAGAVRSGIPAIRSVVLEGDYDPYILRAFEVGVPYPVIPNRDVWNVFNEELNRFWRERIPASTVAQAIQERVEPMLNQ
ncbi:MAG: sugar ABC transporter substrate-binding protein [Firmicutes bacterium]|nr:sugar ABC transporter substrate-binding protein [Bacillota bacterium]